MAILPSVEIPARDSGEELLAVAAGGRSAGPAGNLRAAQRQQDVPSGRECSYRAESWTRKRVGSQLGGARAASCRSILSGGDRARGLARGARARDCACQRDARAAGGECGVAARNAIAREGMRARRPRLRNTTLRARLRTATPRAIAGCWRLSAILRRLIRQHTSRGSPHGEAGRCCTGRQRRRRPDTEAKRIA